MTRFSVVVPCYNSFCKMEECLKSLENQTFKDFEVVFIDDCSKDDTFDKLKHYLKETKLDYKLIKNEENLGAGLTRNKGIENATGEYITFLDADDYIEKETLELLNNVIEKEKVDCVLFDYYYKTKKNNIYGKTISNTREGKVEKSIALVNSTGSTCCKVYLLKNILKNNVRFPNLIRNEDMVFNKIAISTCNSFYYLEKPLYIYVEHKGSLMNSKELLNEENAIKGYKLVEEKLKENYPKEIESMFLKEYFYSVTMTLVEKKKSSKEIKEHIRKCEEKYPNIYELPCINELSKFQKYCLKFIKQKNILFLKILVLLKKVIKKVR